MEKEEFVKAILKEQRRRKILEARLKEYDIRDYKQNVIYKAYKRR